MLQAVSGGELKREVAELLETLVDLHEICAAPGGAEAVEFSRAGAALIPLLLAGYGASLGPTDQALLRLINALDRTVGLGLFPVW